MYIKNVIVDYCCEKTYFQRGTHYKRTMHLLHVKDNKVFNMKTVKVA